MDKPVTLGSGKYILHPRALRHILHGEFTTRVDRLDGKSVAVDVLSGGLHTYNALMEFLKKKPLITSLYAYDPDTDDDWYYIRELQNGVLTVKLPRQFFASRAASITMLPENFYKSGYLWKTLFPKSYGEPEVLDVIDQALNNIDKENSQEQRYADQEYHIVGYANLQDPMSAMRVQIQLHGNEIRSAFPSWTQPWSGNNGKPYSHADSIVMIISESVGRSRIPHNEKSKFWLHGLPVYELLKAMTPLFLLIRLIPRKGESPEDRNNSRQLELKRIASELNNSELYKIKNYVNDFAICKEASFLQQRLYLTIRPNRISPLDFNACQISQNVNDCFSVLLNYDLERGSDHFLTSMKRYLKIAVIHTGGLHHFELKRLHKLFMDGVLRHHSESAVECFLENLHMSPSRAATYHEFNLNTYNKAHDDEGMSVIGISSGLTMPVEERMLIDFVALNLGENYLTSFNAAEREDIARRIIFSQIHKEHARDCLAYFRASDFDFFSTWFTSLDFSKLRDRVSDSTYDRIIRDYHRMLVMYRQRLVMDDVEAYSVDPYELEFMSSDFCNIVISQHRIKFVSFMHQDFLENLQRQDVSDKIKSRCKVLLDNLGKEAVPLPNVIPEYLDSWMNNKTYIPVERDFSVFER